MPTQWGALVLMTESPDVCPEAAAMTSRSPRRSKEFRRREITRIAAQLFADKGYHATGMSELADAVGLGKGALYYHIGSKEELLYDISARHVEDMVALGEDVLGRDDLTPIEKVRELSRQLMRTIAANLPELTVFFREVGTLNGDAALRLLALRDRFEDIWARVIEEGVNEDMFRTLDPVAIKGLLGLHNYSYIWLEPAGRLSPDEISDVFCDVLLEGVVRDRAGPERTRGEAGGPPGPETLPAP